MKKEISICCITYNQKKYIRDAIEGFLEQTIIDKCEILIHDDASTDGTIEILKEYAKKYPHIIKIFLEEKNQYSLGDHQMFPRLLKWAQGEYVAFCEGDDYWRDKKKLQIQYDFMKKNANYSMCFHAGKVYDCKKHKYTKVQHAYLRSKDVEMKDIILKGGNFIPTASIFCKKEFLDNLPRFFFEAPVGDYPLQLILASKGKVYYHNREMSLYRRYTETSVSDTLYNSDEEYYLLNKNLGKMLISFSQYTNNKYDDIIKYRVTGYGYNILSRKKDLKTILGKKEYRDYLFSLSPYQIMRTFLKCMIKDKNVFLKVRKSKR